MNLKRSVNMGFVIAFIVLVFAGGLVYREQQKRIERKASAHLTTMLMLRESVLRSYFESLRSEVILWSNRSTIVDIMLRVTADFDRRGKASLDEIGRTDIGTLQGALKDSGSSLLDERAKRFAAHHRYYDVFFISKEGDILYTVAKEDDSGTNLVDGPYADSGLGRLFRGLLEADERDQVIFEDFSAYSPSGGEPAAFIGSPVYSGNRRIGFYAVQIPAAPIDAIMQFSAGMGETGEIYLVGRDRLMRSDSRFFEESSIMKTTVSGVTVGNALEGEIGIAIVDDYRGTPVFSAYRPFEFEGTRWAVLAEQDVAEVYAPLAETLQAIVIGYFVIFVVGALLRWMLVHAVFPAALAAFLGFSLLDSADDA
jgi:methyl-accepting chemotaxis protein